MNNKKGQEEMVGFVLIVLLVCIVILIFLGIYLTQSSSNVQESSQDAQSFLSSVGYYTTGCAISYVPAYSTIQDLLAQCYSNPGELCLSGETVCEALNDSLYYVLNASWQYGSQNAIKGYFFNSSFVVNDSNGYSDTPIMSISAGNCSSTRYGSEPYYSSFQGGSIKTSFYICY